MQDLRDKEQKQKSGRESFHRGLGRQRRSMTNDDRLPRGWNPFAHMLTNPVTIVSRRKAQEIGADRPIPRRDAKAPL